MVTFMNDLPQPEPMRLRLYPSPVLNQPGALVITPPDSLLLGKMVHACHYLRGYALAAQQIGITQRFFVISRNKDLPSSAPEVVINPEISGIEGEDLMTESCLSIPGFKATFRRHARFTLHYNDADMVRKTYQCRGLLARVVQHEMDHLDGKLFTERLQGVLYENGQAHLRKMAQR